MADISVLNKDTGILSCLECGKCTSVCPVSRIGQSFSPRSMMSMVVEGDHEGMALDERVWDCLTCGQCQPRCHRHRRRRGSPVHAASSPLPLDRAAAARGCPRTYSREVGVESSPNRHRAICCIRTGCG